MAPNLTTLKGWTISAVAYSGGYVTMTITKSGKSKTITVDPAQLFDSAGNRFNINV